MGIKDKISKYYQDSYLKKYGDRLTQFQGSVLSVKIEEKTVLWVFHKLNVTIMARPDRSRTILKCSYRKNKWFSKPNFINVKQGNNIIVQGLKSSTKDNKEFVEISNILNLTTKQDLVPVDHSQLKAAKQRAPKMR